MHLGEPLVVKIIEEVGYPFRDRFVVVSGGWLPLWVAGCLLWFFGGTWFSRAEPGVMSYCSQSSLADTVLVGWHYILCDRVEAVD